MFSSTSNYLHLDTLLHKPGANRSVSLHSRVQINIGNLYHPDTGGIFHLDAIVPRLLFLLTDDARTELGHKRLFAEPW